MALTQTAHQYIKYHLRQTRVERRLAIDATCGNGHDTAFLNTLGFRTIIGFDIQAEALTATRKRLNQQDKKATIKLYQCSHQTMLDYVQAKSASCIMFNFGYLPNSDKSIVTQPTSSLKAVQAAITALHPEGILSLLCYPGHPEGHQELLIINDYLQQLPRPWQVQRIDSPTINHYSPILFLVFGHYFTI